MKRPKRPKPKPAKGPMPNVQKSARTAGSPVLHRDVLPQIDPAELRKHKG